MPGTGVGPPSRLDNPWLGGGESADQPGTIVVAVVDCIEVVGTSAVIGGNTFRTGGVTFTDPWNVWLVDNGPPGGPNPT